jgi:hypothetical protein
MPVLLASYPYVEFAAATKPWKDDKLSLGLVEFGSGPFDCAGEMTVTREEGDTTLHLETYYVLYFEVKNAIQLMPMRHPQTGEAGLAFNPGLFASMKVELANSPDFEVTLPPHAVTYVRAVRPAIEKMYRQAASGLDLSGNIPNLPKVR